MNNTYMKIFEKHEFNFGRMILGSKSSYRQKYPGNEVVFNARIYLKSFYETHKEKVQDFFNGQEDEIWFGDLDLTLEIDELNLIQKEIGEPIVVTSEHGKFIREIE